MKQSKALKQREGIEIFRRVNRIDPKAFVSQSNVMGYMAKDLTALK